jgi:hypothetical protein
MRRSLQRLLPLLLLLQGWAEERDCQPDGSCAEESREAVVNDSEFIVQDDSATASKHDESTVKETEPVVNKKESAPAIDPNVYETLAGSMQIPEPPLSNEQCNLFMAESAIPHAGWGMYTAIPLKKGSVMKPLDLAIQVQDQVKYQKLVNKLPTSQYQLPDWLMEQYYWNARVTFADYDGNSIDSIIPSFGMLANSHTGLVNLFNQGCQKIETHTDGSQTMYREQSFTLLSNLEAGHELFADYGDSWFEEREETYGPMPLSRDWKQANGVLKKFHELCNGKTDSEFCKDLWQLVRVDLAEATPSRLSKALPEHLEAVPEVLEHGTAHHSLPNVVRSLDWLHEYGMCLDHMQAGPSDIAGMGAFATRKLPQGSLVAPVPLIHMHRDHLAVLIAEQSDSTKVLWRGHQLLLNYCYGHSSSSLVFFPYSPVVNFINHSKEPNVKLQWSSRMARKEWLQLSTEELLEHDHSAGLMMEFVALKDIQEGEEIVVDYGSPWEQAYKEFQFEDDRNGDWKEAEELREIEILPKEHDKHNPLPDNVMTVCWIPDVEDMTAVPGEKNSYQWSKMRTKYLDYTNECSILQVRQKVPPLYLPMYDVKYKLSKKESIIVKSLPRRAIEIVDRPYTKSQYRRNTFRHEIHLPDDMIPIGWRDLEDYPSECGLYMAESSIPNSGLGMYTAQEIGKNKQVFHGDVVIQIADYKLNRKLRHWFYDTNKGDEPTWLLDNYYWNADNTLGEHETERVYSIVPGMGMLANSHTGLINSGMLRPKRESGGIHRSTHPSAGTSTTFHDLAFATFEHLEAGSELFVEYGDNWFKDRKELGLVPLSKDFKESDAMLEQFYKLVGEDVESDMAKDLWALFWNTSSPVEDSRVRNAFPRDLQRVPEVIESGTAKNSVPNRIRSLDWLKENGMCLDNIKSDQSKVAGAHRGAFATRPLKQGEVIAPVPVAHIRREYLEIYDSDNVQSKKNKPWYDSDQLLLNYCYGHTNSSVLLFPYAPVVNYINHSPKKYNAEMRWSSLPTQRQDFKEMHPDELMEHDHAGLILELVATKAIDVGEEILLDYGDRWERAWTKWVKNWQSYDDDEDYIPAFELNDYLTPVKTKDEQRKDPYRANLITVCFVIFDEDEPISKNKKKEPIYNFESKKYLYETTDDAYRCDILERSEDKKTYLDDTVAPSLHTYTVRIHIKETEKAIIRKVPRRAIEFFDKAYKSDFGLTNTFRHEIGLPDHLLPPAWVDYDTPYNP